MTIVEFEGDISEYTISKNSDGSYTVEDNIIDRSGEDQVANVESFNFGGTTYSSTQIDSSHLSSDDSVPPEITMDSNPNYDWTVEIAEDNNFDNIEPSNWMEDIDSDNAHDHASEYDDSADPINEDIPLEQDSLENLVM